MIAAGMWLVAHMRGWAGEDAVLLSLGGGAVWGSFLGLPWGAAYAAGAAGCGLLAYAVAWAARRGRCPTTAVPCVVVGWFAFLALAALA